jgi:hypothetical protein
MEGMMRHTWMLAGAAAMALAGAAAAQPRDTPPPGCRWFGDDLGCKDGRGHYLRAGDDEVIGRKATAEPKPRPRPRREAQAAPTEVPPAPSDIASAASVPVAASAEPVAEVATPAAEASAVSDPAPAAVAPAKPWWQAVWDWLVNDFMNLLRRLGLAK